MYKILSVSRNTRLLLQRNDTLALAGFHVISPRTPDQAPYLAYEQHADAVVLGHSIEEHMRQTLIEMLRRLRPDCAVVFVYVGPKQEDLWADVSVDVSSGNEPLIAALQQLLPKGLVASGAI